ERLKKAVLCALIPLVGYIAIELSLYGSWFIQDLWLSFGRVNIILLALATILLLYITARREVLKKALDWFHFSMDKVGWNTFMFYLPLTLLVLLIPPSDKTMVDPINYFWVVGVIGFLFIENELKRNLVWIFYISYLGILAAYNRADHMVIPLHPLISLGAAVFIIKIFHSRDRILSGFKDRLSVPATTAIVLILVAYPIAILAYQDVDGFILGNNFGVTKIKEVEMLWDFINKRASPGDMVLTQSYFSQNINCRTTILLHAIAYDGRPISYYPPLSPQRFYYNTSLRNIKYAILPNGIVEALNQSGYYETASELESWLKVYETNTSEDAGTPSIYDIEKRMIGIESEGGAISFQVLENPEKKG
ncbi:MAG: hypothetical protein V1703_01550, partial [Candidatus Altiarchaeota archaeon]